MDETTGKRGPGRPVGSSSYAAHNALARAFWKVHVDWKAELAQLYVAYRKTGKRNAYESLKIWMTLLPYLAVSERYRYDKKLGKYRKKPKVSKRAVQALKDLEAKAAVSRPLTYGEQVAYAPGDALKGIE